VRSAVDAHSIANEIRMSRTVRKRASALLLEASKDVRVFRNIINESLCDIVATEGKRNAIGALNILRRAGERGVLVIVDSDFSRLDGQRILDPDVLTSDLHDIEAMLLQSSAVQKVMIEYDLAPDGFGQNLGQVLAEAVMPLGYLRFASLQYKLHLKFGDLEFRKFVLTKVPTSIDEHKLVEEVLNKNPRCTRSEKDLSQMMADIAKVGDDCWHVGCGHDMTSVLAVLLSVNAGREILSYSLERQLRLAYPVAEFSATALFAEIKAWEQRNTPYIVLA
jgi:hypothetical protein